MALPHRVLSVCVLATAGFLTGCGAFFQCEGKTSCPTTGTGSNSGDYVYVSNSTTATTYISGYSITSGALTAISGAALDLGFVPVAMNVSPNNDFLYVASSPGSETPGIYLYTISTTGALTAANNGDPLINDDTIASMDISPDGSHLYTVGTSTVGVLMNEYTLNTSTGLVTAGPTSFSPGGTSCTVAGSPSTGTPVSQQCTVKVSPNGDFVGVAVGTAGFTTYPSTSAGGITSAAGVNIGALDSSSGDFSVAFDKNDYAYVASTQQLTSYGDIGTTPVVETYETYAAGQIPRSVALSTGYDYVYTANEGASTISGFSLSGAAVMTEIGTAAIPGPTNVSAIAADNSGKYLVAAGYNETNGLQLFNITSTGALTTASSIAGTGSSLTVPVVMALSH